MDGSKITNETEVSTTELACVLGITGRRIRQLAEDGQMVKLAQGRFNLCDSVQRYIKAQNKDTQSEEDRKFEKTRRTADVTLKMSKAQVAKMEMQELQGKMHRSEDVAAEAAEVIRKEVHKVMRELAAYRYDPEKYEERVRQRRDWETASGRDDDDE